MSVWFVTGASRGFGAEIVEKALAAGHSVVATARDPRAISARFPDAGDQLLPVALDVLDEAQRGRRSMKRSSASAASMCWSTTRATACCG